jgi:acyl transferase domain-containing protein/acyl carrier protein/SAM-dependent methyltransferase
MNGGTREVEPEAMDALLLRLLGAILAGMGVPARSGTEVPGEVAEDVAASAGILPRYTDWVAESLRRLAACPVGTGLGPAGGGVPWWEWDAALREWRRHPVLGPRAALLDGCLRALADVLTGRTAPLEVLFPDSSPDLVEAVYRDNPEADAGRVALAREVADHLAGAPARAARVAEVGAGTGATSAAVLDVLRERGIPVAEYAFTDVARTLLERARERFGAEHPGLTFQLLDLERDPGVQGFPPGAYDVVVAANVLHATSSIRSTLARVKSLLRPGGLLVANEIVHSSLFAHLTFGLLDGWWDHRDPELRVPGSPGLSERMWSRLLREEGLWPATLVEVPGSEPGQRLIRAASDGLVRTGAHPPPAPASSPAASDRNPRPAGPMRSAAPLAARLADHLTALVADALKTTPAKIRDDEPLQTYGLDSLIVVWLTGLLRGSLGKISSTLFFEYPTIAELAGHLASEREAEVERLLGDPGVRGTGVTSVDAGAVRPAPVPGPARAGGGSDGHGERHNGGHRHTDTDTEIAVIGLAGRYPGARDLNEFWANLRAGRNCVTEVPRDRWDRWDGRSGAASTRWGGFLDDIGAFDSLFFRISPAEAETMDPQERLFLETAYSAIEDAGHTPATLSPSRRVGVFVGVMNGNYPTGANFWSVANRASYTLDFCGPSFAVDSACSSSLTAIHLAVQSIRSGDCDCAVAGGVNLIVAPVHLHRLEALGMLSAGERCRAFGAGADGFVDAEGVGAAILKPLTAAVRDGDVIHGVIRASGVNAGGRTGGYTVPNPRAQAELVARTLARAGCDPAEVSYVEAHGTGTALGDPIEVAGLTRAFGAAAGRGYCALGSVKSNIGHCESAAGIAGLTKVLLQLRHGELVPSLHAEVPNPEIDFADTPFVVQRRLGPWARPTHPAGGATRTGARVAAVSSFGAGGANAHLVVAEYLPEDEPVEVGAAPSGPWPVVLSARTEEALRERAWALVQAVDAGRLDGAGVCDISHTLRAGREAMRVRLGFLARTRDELAAVLRAYLAGQDSCHYHHGTVGAGSEEPYPARARPGDLEALVRHWVGGGAVDWPEPGSGRCPRRVPLPTYPFAGPVHWISAPAPPPVRPDGTDRSHRADVSGVSGGAGDDAPPPVLLRSEWVPTDADLDAGSGQRFARHVVLLVGGWARRSVEAAVGAPVGPPAEVRHLPVPDGPGDRRMLAVALDALAALADLMRAGVRGRVLVQVVVPAGDPAGAALAGLVRTAARENPKLATQLVELDPAAGGARLARHLARDAARPSDRHVRHDAAGRAAAHLRPVGDSRTAHRVPWRAGGVYLITGGTGRLGLLTAREIAHRVGHCTIVLVARGEPDAAVAREISGIRATGASVEFRAADVSRADEVADLVAGVRAAHGALHGVIHCAGVVEDGLILTRSSESARRVIAPKVSGVVNLDRATADLPLEMMLLFSSAAASIGNVGQADYAMANAFLDRFARDRNRQVASGHRSGRTLSIGWSQWQDGGMRWDDDTARWMAAATGAVDLPTGTAMRAIYQAAATDADHVTVFAGDEDKIMEYLAGDTGPRLVSEPVEPSVPWGAEARPGPGADRAAVLDRMTARLLAQLSGIAKLPAGVAEPHEPLESYGINSTMIVQWTLQLEQAFPDVPKTMFFETRTVANAAEYLLEEYPDAAWAWVGTAPGRPAEPVLAAVTPRAVAAAHDTPPTGDRWPAPADRPGPAPTADRVDPAREPIAIVGMSGRYPMAENLGAFWENLVAGRDCISEIPAERWGLADFYEHDPDQAAATGKSYGKWGGFVDSFADFDSRFFRLSPRETATIDPQERLYMVACWEALEDAGYTRAELARRHDRNVGVFAGITKTGFTLYRSEGEFSSRRREPLTSFASAANRVSYLLDLRGPSMPVDTMCSSSLVAIHEACQHIYSGDCELALAGGVNLYLHPSNYVVLCANRMLSVDGRCKSFGSQANGYVPGEGVGVVVLKRLSEAIADHDQIHAVVRSSAVNHGGHTHGYTVPNPTAQRDLIRTVLDRAGVDARAVGYIEAHGTGTDLGDPIEITGLTQAFRNDTDDVGYCAIGSVKSNIGHLEAAAGIAGLTKVVLQMRHRTLVPSLHAEQTNPNIRFERTPFSLQRERAPWAPNGAGTLIAGVSSFGAGGANAHILLEEPPARPAHPERAPGPVFVVLSARTEEQLEQQVRQLLDAIGDGTVTDDTLADAAFTLQVGREALEERLALSVGDVAQLAAGLRSFLDGKPVGVQQGQTKAHRELVSLLVEDDVALSTRRLMAAGRHATALKLWCLGAPIGWFALHGDRLPYRMSLPTYPFARQRHWVRGTSTDLDTVASAAAPPATAAPPAAAGPEVPDWRAQRPTPPELGPAAPARTGRNPAPDRSGGGAGRIRLSPLLGLSRPAPAHPEPAAPRPVPAPPGNPVPRAMPRPAPADPVESPAAVSPEVDPAGPEPTGPKVTAAELRTDLSTSLAEILALDEEDIDQDATFTDLGLDSIIGVEWVQGIKARYGLDLTASRIYSYPTIRRFTEFLLPRLGPRRSASPADLPAPEPRHASEPTSLSSLLDGVASGEIEPAAADRLFETLAGDRR